MKYLILILLSLNSFAGIPISEVVKAINLEPNAGSITCEQLPQEQCFDYSGVNWHYAELIDNKVIDYISKVDEVACESELDCDDKFAALDCAEKIKNYELLSVYCAVPVMKIGGKKLVENKAKKAAHEAAKVEEEAQELTKRDRKKAVRKALKEADLDGANSIVKLKAIVKALIEAQE